MKLLIIKLQFLVIGTLILMNFYGKIEANEITMEEGYIDTDYGKIYYKKLFTPANKNNIPLLALHGGPGLTHDSIDTLGELASEFPIIFYDQTGSGKSNKFDKDKVSWDIDFFLKDLEHVINFFNLKEIYLFGFSWGGNLALEYALKPNKLIKKIIIASPFLSSRIWTRDTFALLEKLDPNFKEVVLKHIQENTIHSDEYQKIMHLFNQNYLYRLPEWTDSMNYSVKHMNSEISEAMFGKNDFILDGNLKNYERINDVKAIKIPLLVTCGRYDWARPDTLAEAIKGMENAQLFVLEQSAHMAHIEEKELYLQKLKDFLKDECLVIN